MRRQYPPLLALRFLLCSVALSCVGIVGCGTNPPPAGLDDALILELAGLPGARKSPRVELTEEIVRLEQESATPKQLASVTIPAGEAAPFPVGLFGDDLQRADEKSQELFPQSEFVMGPIELERVIAFRQRYEQQRLQIRKWTASPQGVIPTEHERGWFAEKNPAPAISIVMRLEAFLVAEHLAANRLEEATDSLEQMHRLIERLSQSQNLDGRLAAVRLREEVFLVLAALLEHSGANLVIAKRLQNLLSDILGRWPRDSQAWIGERALGLHTYEVVRSGHLLKILTREEVKQFADEGILGEFEGAATRNLDGDELFYLRSMRSIITSCEARDLAVPLVARQKVIVDVLKQIETRRGSSEYPLVAARLLLPDVLPGHKLQALDRARCEAWLLAIAAATNSPRPSDQSNPLTGEPYVLHIEPHRVVVRGVGGAARIDEPPIIVRRFDVRLSRLP